MPVIRHRLLSTLFVWCLFSIVACGAGLTPDEYLTNAKDYIDKDEFQAAAIELSNALQEEPGMLEARWLLATVAIELGDGARAEKEITKAMELGLAQQSAQPLLVKSIYLQSDWDRVIAETNRLAEGMPKADQALILGLRGRAYLAKDEFDEAKKTLDAALVIDPGSPAALVGMAAFNGLQQEYGEARRWVQRALDEDASSAEAWSALGDVEMMEGNFEEAETAFTNAMKFRQYTNLDQAKRALVRTELEKFRDAEADIQSLKKQGFKKNPYVNYVEGINYFKQEKYAEAAEAFQASYSSTPNSLRAGIYLATAHLMLGNLEQAQSITERISAQAPRSRTTQRLLGTILANRMEYGAALDVLRKSLNDAPDDPVILGMLANVSLFDGNTSQGVAYAQKLVSVAPESRSAKGMLSLAKLMNGQKLDDEVAGDSDFEVEFLYAAEAFKKNNFGEALERAQKLHKSYPEKVEPLNLMAACYIALGEWDKAKNEMEKVLEIRPNEPSAVRNLAKVEAQKGRLEHARKLLQGLLEDSPGDEQAILLLAEIETQLGNPMDGIRVLERSAEKNPNALSVRAKLAGEHFRASHFAKVLEVTRDLTEEQLQEQPVLLELRGKAQMRVGDIASARRTFGLWVEAAPKSAQAHFLYGDSLTRSGKTERGRKELERSVQLDPDYLPARIGEIKMLVHYGEMERAQELLDAAKRDFGNRPEVLGIEGWLALGAGNYATAEERFSMAAEQKPDTELTILWVRALWAQQKYDDAFKVMQDWLKDHPQDLTVLLQLAGGYLTLNRDGEARAMYARVIELYPNHVAALNNIAWLSRGEDIEQAIAYAERAYKLSPNDPQVLDTLGMLLLQKGDARRGYSLIREAATLSPGDLEIQLHLGSALVQQERFAEAQVVLSGIVKKAPDSPIAAEAKELLESVSQR